MKKTKNRKPRISLKEIPLQALLSAALKHKKLRGGNYRLCPNCWFLDAFLVVGGDVEDFSTYYCKRCGAVGKHFPEFSVKELQAAAKRVLQKKTRKSVKKRARRKN